MRALRERNRAARRVLCLVGLTLLAGAPSRQAAAQGPSAPAPVASDVRQVITFLFQPGLSDSGQAIYRRELVPLYRQDAAMRRFRGFREGESPEPLDLIVVSSFDGLSGMEASNLALRSLSSGGRSTFQWYGQLAATSQHHHDQLVEMLPALGDPAVAAADSVGGLTAFEYVRLVPGQRRAFEWLVANRMRAVERAGARDAGPVRWSETGRLMLSDGWDYLRIVRLGTLADWQAYQQALARAGVSEELDRLVAARKTILVRQLPALSVR
jgi:hypothetical protein